MTKNGPVKGERRVNELAPFESYLAFHAIPFAEPPIGDMRFEHSVTHSNWSDIFDATNPDHTNKCCPQVNLVNNLVNNW